MGRCDQIITVFREKCCPVLPWGSIWMLVGFCTLFLCHLDYLPECAGPWVILFPFLIPLLIDSLHLYTACRQNHHASFVLFLHPGKLSLIWSKVILSSCLPSLGKPSVPPFTCSAFRVCSTHTEGTICIYLTLVSALTINFIINGFFSYLSQCSYCF